MIQHKYGEFTDSQFHAFKERLHRTTHWCLIYAEQKSPIVCSYIEKQQIKFQGLNSLLEYSPIIPEIINLFESAKLEYHAHQYKTPLYRKLILDIHKLIDNV